MIEDGQVEGWHEVDGAKKRMAYYSCIRGSAETTQKQTLLLCGREEKKRRTENMCKTPKHFWADAASFCCPFSLHPTNICRVQCHLGLRELLKLLLLRHVHGLLLLVGISGHILHLSLGSW